MKLLSGFQLPIKQCFLFSLNILENVMFAGTGYHLTMMKEPQSPLEPITNTIKRSVAGAELKSAHVSQVTYSVPQEAAAKMPGLFSTIEREKDNLGIKGVGISCTTMEEVFLK